MVAGYPRFCFCMLQPWTCPSTKVLLSKGFPLVAFLSESERFQLFQSMPGPNIFAMIGAGVAAALAGPIIVVSLVGALGFGASGIAAGSAAAGLMSAQATAAGGAIAAGSTVAVFQSIGAAGLGVAGTAAASAVSGSVAATTAGILTDSSKDDCGNNETVQGDAESTSTDLVAD